MEVSVPKYSTFENLLFACGLFFLHFLGTEVTELIPQGKLVLVHSVVTIHFFLRERKRPAMLKPAFLLV